MKNKSKNKKNVEYRTGKMVPYNNLQLKTEISGNKSGTVNYVKNPQKEQNARGGRYPEDQYAVGNQNRKNVSYKIHGNPNSAYNVSGGYNKQNTKINAEYSPESFKQRSGSGNSVQNGRRTQESVKKRQYQNKHSLPQQQNSKPKYHQSQAQRRSQAPMQRQNPVLFQNAAQKPNRLSVQRQQQRNQIKRLTPQQREQLRQKELFEKKKRKEKVLRSMVSALKLFFKRMAVLFVLYVIFMLATIGCMAIDIFSHSRSEKAEYQLQFGNDEKKPKNNVVCEALNIINGEDITVYIKMSDVAGQFGWIVTGDKDELRYIIKYNESYESVLFENGSADAYINNVRVKLSGKAIFNGFDDVYVPADFLEKYLRGITYTVDTDSQKIVICRELESEIGAEETVYTELSFTVKAPVTSNPIEEKTAEMMTR